jgi:hypothetical protein
LIFIQGENNIFAAIMMSYVNVFREHGNHILSSNYYGGSLGANKDLIQKVAYGKYDCYEALKYIFRSF